MAVNQVGDGSADGVQLPNTKAGFFGVAPVAQPAAPGSILSTSAVVQGGYGYATTQATALITTVNALRAAMVALGLTAGP